jgi:sugar O-acyltransferase (sialic acid O-acetyltransferase NeuD family)
MDQANRHVSKRGLQRIAVLGGPGDGLSVAEAVHRGEAAGQPITLIGFLNDTMARGEMLQGVPILGKLDEWREVDDDILFIPAVQKVKDMPRRVQRIERLEIPNDRWGVVIHPMAAVSSDVEIGVGSFVLSGATIQPGARIGRFAGVRAGAMLGHHCVIGDHTYVGPNATMCGRSVLHEAAHLGPGAVLMEPRVMGRYSIAGISAAVTRDVPEFWIVFGNPAKRVGWVKRLAPG